VAEDLETLLRARQVTASIKLEAATETLDELEQDFARMQVVQQDSAGTDA
jgi:hypothetical protein